MAIPQQDWSSKWALYRPDHIACKEWETGRRISWRQLDRTGNRLAHYISTEFEIGKGDRIAVMAENCLEYLQLFAAAQKTGCILVPLNYRLAGPELDYLLGDAEPKLVIGEEKFVDALGEGANYGKVPHRMRMEELSERCRPETSTKYDEHFRINPVGEDDPVFILYTSGTTGFPKGALYTHKMLFWNSVNTAISLVVNSESRTINCMPPFHTGGWNVLTTPFRHRGGYVCLFKKFDPSSILEALPTEQVTLFMGVPTMLKMIADEPAFDRADLSDLHYLIVGGEPMPVPLIEKWDEKGVPVRQGYGMTEVGPNLTSLHQDDAIRKKGSIGRPNFYVRTKLVDEEGNEVKTGEAGELLLRGPMVTPGYWRNPAATKEALRDGWFRTGDLVKEDEEGYLYVVDRIKNMYISGGENVYPAEVERVILGHPAVAEVAVIGIPHEKWGEAGRAFVVRSASASEEDILDFCRQKLAKFKVPKSVVFLDALPKNDTGKIDKKALRAIGK
ncbi:MAG: long-chain fatty acid--CoA ligase [Saprospiraceae bacterium]|nr:long-chain fatty acid--CoA ligase [Saprospiraceae bacterium]